MKNNKQDNLKKWNMKKDIVIPVIVALTVAGASAIIENITWRNQYNIEHKQKILEKKMELLNDMSNSIFKCEQLIKYKFEYENLVNYYSMPNKEKSVEDSAEIDDLIKSNRPHTYEKYLEYLDFEVNMRSKLSVSKLYFSETTSDSIEAFEVNVLDKEYLEYLEIYENYVIDNNKIPLDVLYGKDDTIKFYNDLLMESASDYIKPYREKVLDSMHEEIDSKYRNK